MPESEITASVTQYRALAHPLRQRLLFLLDGTEATTSQLAAQLDTLKGNIAHHLKVLESAGLVRIVRSRQVRGGTEQYYGRTSTEVRIPRESTTGDPLRASSFIQAVADEMATAPESPVFLGIRHARLTAEQVAQLKDVLSRIANPDDLPDAGPDERRYGIALTLYPTE